jgi:hypothetical protein
MANPRGVAVLVGSLRKDSAGFDRRLDCKVEGGRFEDFFGLQRLPSIAKSLSVAVT